MQVATHWLSSLGRFCWKQVRLGRAPSSTGAAQPAEDVRQTGVSGNTIFFAQPTAEVPRMTMPPDEGDFLNSLNVLFTKNTQLHDLQIRRSIDLRPFRIVEALHVLSKQDV